MAKLKRDELEDRDAQKQTRWVALIVAPPGRLSDGWQALLLATPQIAEVRQVHDLSSALETAHTREPDLILFNGEPFGCRPWAEVRQIKEKWPHCCCVVLVCYARQRQEALATGADEVLIRGFAAVQLSTAVEQLFERGCQDHTP
jgi:DNA-binding NarL/FixJ family response regulator